MTRAVLDYEVPGIADAIRAYGIGKGIETAALSRGLAGVAGRTLDRQPAGIGRRGEGRSGRADARSSATRWTRFAAVTIPAPTMVVRAEPQLAGAADRGSRRASADHVARCRPMG